MKIPTHVAIIVDGNRRWARKRGLPEIVGHKFVADKIIDPLVFRCLDWGIKYLTLWAFSTENWRRGEKFASAIFRILRQGLKKSIEKYKKAGIRLKVIGNLSKIPADLVKTTNQWVEESKDNKKLTVIIALNYGGRDEIVRAIRRASAKCKVQSAKFTEEEFEKYLDTVGIPDPDLIIRTGGAQRLSGFLMWQSAYSELYFTDVLMPDFDIKEFDKAIKEFGKRERRYGR